MKSLQDAIAYRNQQRAIHERLLFNAENSESPSPSFQFIIDELFDKFNAMRGWELTIHGPGRVSIPTDTSVTSPVFDLPSHYLIKGLDGLLLSLRVEIDLTNERRCFIRLGDVRMGGDPKDVCSFEIRSGENGESLVRGGRLHITKEEALELVYDAIAQQVKDLAKAAYA